VAWSPGLPRDGHTPTPATGTPISSEAAGEPSFRRLSRPPAGYPGRLRCTQGNDTERAQLERLSHSPWDSDRANQPTWKTNCVIEATRMITSNSTSTRLVPHLMLARSRRCAPGRSGPARCSAGYPRPPTPPTALGGALRARVQAHSSAVLRQRDDGDRFARPQLELLRRRSLVERQGAHAVRVDEQSELRRFRLGEC